MAYFAPGHRSHTAWAITCAVECRSTSRSSASAMRVMVARACSRGAGSGTAGAVQVLAALGLGQFPGELSPGDPDQIVEVEGPDPGRPVPGPGGQLGPVGAEREPAHHEVMPTEHQPLDPGFHIPDPYGVVEAGRR